MDKVAIGLMISGAALCSIAFVGSGMMMNPIPGVVVFTLGFLVMAGGLIAYLDKDIVKAWRYKEPYIWLLGVNRNYLEKLPNWSERKA